MQAMKKGAVIPQGRKRRVLALNTEIRASISTFSGKWKLEILWLLSQREHRFGDLRRELPEVTAHTLTQRLRELERDGMIRRTEYPETPPRVEYALTDKTRGLEPVFSALFAWGTAQPTS